MRQRVLQPLNNKRGVALMIAIAAIMVIMYFAMEVSYDSNVEYIVNSQGLNRVKAYYAAKSGMQLSLLRIKIYQQAQDKFGEQLGSSGLLDQIWKFPFAWPLPVPDEVSAVDKDSFKKIFKESSMDSSYIVTIEDEGSKIDLNDLASPSKFLREATKQQILNIFEQRKNEDEKFAQDSRSVQYEELVNNIADWMSSKNESAGGGDKRAKFSELNSAAQSDYFPPNRGFRTLGELRMVPGMTDELYNMLESRVTVFGMKGINPNLASKDVLKSLDPGMTDEAVAAILKRRESQNEGGPFKCDQDGSSSDFWSFVETTARVRLMGDPKSIPMTCDTVMNFKIKSTGEFAGATREITAIVMDLNRAASKIKSYVDKEKEAEAGTGAKKDDKNKNKPTKDKIQKGPPRIVFWSER